MIGLVQRSVERDPDQLALVGETRTLTYGRLLADARTVAAHLRHRGVTQVAVAEDDPVTSIVVLVGAAYAGIEVCVMPRAATDETVVLTAERIGGPTVVTSRVLEGPDVVATSDLWADIDPDLAGEAADDGSVLVLTSGTSGFPRAARHLWNATRQTGTAAGATT